MKLTIVFDKFNISIDFACVHKVNMDMGTAFLHHPNDAIGEFVIEKNQLLI